jgi:hypothetical protein
MHVAERSTTTYRDTHLHLVDDLKSRLAAAALGEGVRHVVCASSIVS